MSEARRTRRASTVLFGLQIATFAAVFIPLLPILLPVALAVGAVSDARTERRLARTRCVTCREAIGLAEIRRAKADGGTKAAAQIQAILALGHKPRVVAIWDVICPTCGHKYTFRPDAKPQALVSVAS